MNRTGFSGGGTVRPRRQKARRTPRRGVSSAQFAGTPASKWIVAGIVAVVVAWWLLDGGAVALLRALSPREQPATAVAGVSEVPAVAGSGAPVSRQDQTAADSSDIPQVRGKPAAKSGGAKAENPRPWPPSDGEWVRGWGTVAKVLPDDTVPPCHQRFFLVDAAGRQIFVAHNIDVAKRLDSLREGDKVEFFGEWLDNDRGGVLPWTHKDASGRRRGGWLRRGGVRYD